MYSYSHDPETGGLLLNDNTQYISNEPRPVYTQELDILGIDRYWNYDRQTDIPYMWAESNNYIYRGKKIFKTKGGSLYEKPEIEIQYDNGSPVLKLNSNLEPVDIEKMNRKNEVLLNAIRQITVKKIENTYKKYKNRLDCFHVAFSGGKDSIVLLDLVKKALPKSSFIVIFGDTKMEFPDTYKTVDRIEEECRKEDIDFYRASSHLDPEKSWRMFGPPSRVLRWCCTVHKSAPQILTLREILQKNDYVGMDFVGVRAAESTKRSEYEEECYGVKQKGQYSHNPILQWTSAEIWLYIYANNLIINETYKKGNARAGCLFCPMSSGKSNFFRHINYKNEVEQYVNIIKETIDDPEIDSYIKNEGWLYRNNGRDIKNNKLKCYEETQYEHIKITVQSPNTDYNQWIKTLSDIEINFNTKQQEDVYEITLSNINQQAEIRKLSKQIFRKAAYCVGCRACEANCTNGAISFKNGLQINNCIYCKQCHNIPDGCLVYHSMKFAKDRIKMTKSLNTFSDHAPKPQWIISFFENGNKFLEDNTLGPMQILLFRRFLSDSGLIEKGSTTEFFDIIKKNGYEKDSSWGLIYINLVNQNPQINWYVENMPIEKKIYRSEFETLLTELSISPKDASSIFKAFKRLTEIPMGTILKFGKVIKGENKTELLQRTKCRVTDDRVVLYSLYKYAEECGNYYEFTLSTLLDSTIQSKGVSPVKLFGLEADEMEAILRGLSVKYDDFINVSFTHDLDKIVLRDYHTSQDVLGLF